MGESLKHLLQQADAVPATLDPGDLARAVRRKRVDQSRRHRMMMSAAIVLLVTCAVVLWPKSSRRIITQVPVVETPGSVEVDARLHELTAEALSLSERAKRETARAEAQPDPIAQVHFQRDRAAMTLVYKADRFRAEPQQTDLAIAQYQRVIKLFPTSSWADVARQRLRELAAS